MFWAVIQPKTYRGESETQFYPRTKKSFTTVFLLYLVLNEIGCLSNRFGDVQIEIAGCNYQSSTKWTISLSITCSSLVPRHVMDKIEPFAD